MGVGPIVTVRDMLTAEIRKCAEHLADPALSAETEKWTRHKRVLERKLRLTDDEELCRNAMEF